MRHEQLRRVAILFRPMAGYYQQVLRGVAAYTRPQHPWVFRTIASDQLNLRALFQWRPDGILCSITDLPTARRLARSGIPAVNVARVPSDDLIYRVGNDDAAIAKLAARHFLDRGFRHYAFVDVVQGNYFAPRREVFAREVERAGHKCLCYPPRQVARRLQGSWSADDAHLKQWVSNLPRPSAILCCNDFRAAEVVEACRQAGLDVPNDVAILGIDDARPVCELCFPPLSSIAVPGEQIGRRAAELLDRLMHQQRVSRKPIVLPPLGVIERQSTDVLATADPDLATALRLIRDPHSPVRRIRDVLRQVPVSRRSLERQFRTMLGRSPLEELRRVRVERATTLLASTALPVEAVARASGFANPRHLATTFRRVLRITPLQYRRKYAVGSESVP